MSIGIGQLARRGADGDDIEDHVAKDAELPSAEDGLSSVLRREGGKELRTGVTTSLCSPPSEEGAASAGHPRPATLPALPSLPSPRWWKLRLPPSHVNDVLAANFCVMKMLGDRVLRPFLQVEWGAHASICLFLFHLSIT
jgi:hypothetical protein